MYFNEQAIERIFETEIIPSFTNYVAKHYYKLSEDQLKGELFTQIRRHIPELVEKKNSRGQAEYAITIKNIDRIAMTRQGEIIGIAFCTYRNVLSNQAHRHIIDILNKIMSNIIINVSKAYFKHKLDKIIQRVHNI